MSKKKILALATTMVLIISLIPIVVISKYNVPYYDDYNHGYLIYQAINNGNSIIECIRTAINYTIYIYNNWQGSYFSIFLSSFHPGVFGEQFYGIGSLILFSIHIFTALYTSNILFKKIIKLDKYVWIIIGSLIAFYQIQYLPSVQEGFFWWSGGVMHTLGFDICMLILSTLLLNYFKYSISLIRVLALCILCIMCEGSGYEVALFLPVGIFGFAFFYILFCKYNSQIMNKKLLVESGLYAIISLVFLVINIVAPGNEIRALASGIHVSPILAIMESFIYSFVHIFEYVSIRTLFICIIVIYFAYPFIKKINYKFVHPLFFTVIMWCMFSTIFTPAIYGENYVAAPRYLNVIYFFFYYFIIIISLYIIWYYKNNIYVVQIYQSVNSMIKSVNKYILALIVVFFMGAGVLQFSYADSTSSSAFLDYMLGNAQKYQVVNNERFELLRDESLEDVELPLYDATIRVFPNDLLTNDSSNDINETYARYYQKNSVTLEK